MTSFKLGTVEIKDSIMDEDSETKTKNSVEIKHLMGKSFSQKFMLNVLNVTLFV